jgi:hypothetical protein
MLTVQNCKSKTIVAAGVLDWSLFPSLHFAVVYEESHMSTPGNLNYEIQTVGPGNWSDGLFPRFLKRFLAVLLSLAGSVFSFLTEHGVIGYVLLSIAVLACSNMIAVAVTIRRYRIKTSNIGVRIHDIEHLVREHLPQIARRARDRVERDREVLRFWELLAQEVSEYFSVVFHNRDGRTGCLIWLTDGEYLHLAGRGGEISSDCVTRHCSIATGADRGIVQRIIEKMKQTGVFVINDLDEALRQGDWNHIGLENLACVNCVAVAPINAPPSPHGTRRLLGLLMITTDRQGAIQPIHGECIKAMADRLAAYSLMTEVDESPSATLNFEPSRYVRLAKNMDFGELFVSLRPGQTLYWLDTFCPTHREWLPEMLTAVARGAHIRMLLLDPSADSARKRAAELATCYGERQFMDDLGRFNEAIQRAAAECEKRYEGTLRWKMYNNLLGAPMYIVCDDAGVPIYGYSSEYLCNPSIISQHYCWNSHHVEELEARLSYVVGKWGNRETQRLLF